jgi:hypothetical protein
LGFFFSYFTEWTDTDSLGNEVPHREYTMVGDWVTVSDETSGWENSGPEKKTRQGCKTLHEQYQVALRRIEQQRTIEIEGHHYFVHASSPRGVSPFDHGIFAPGSIFDEMRELSGGHDPGEPLVSVASEEVFRGALTGAAESAGSKVAAHAIEGIWLARQIGALIEMIGSLTVSQPTGSRGVTDLPPTRKKIVQTRVIEARLWRVKVWWTDDCGCHPDSKLYTIPLTPYLEAPSGGNGR